MGAEISTGAHALRICFPIAVLVAADEATMSGKAKKAKEWGIPVISVEKFVTYCTFGK